MTMQVLVLEDDIRPKQAQGAVSRFLVWRPLPLSDLEEHQVVYVTAADDFHWNLASSYQHKYTTLQHALQMAGCWSISQVEVYGVRDDGFQHLYTVTVHPIS